ncbi:MAG: hypothetical protein IPK24_21125 [Kineosporiaceae bacterium]|nr:hypothetical protein [Kineosporiaceae bacterium]
MGTDEQHRLSVQSSRRELDALAQLARQARQDRRWERQMRHRRMMLAGGVAAAMLVTAGIVALVVRNSSSEATPVVATAAASSGAPSRATPSRSPTPTATPTPTPSSTAPLSQAVRMYGKPRSGLAWHSGIWTGGAVTAALADRAGAWRGTPMDFATVYPAYSTWTEIRNSAWAMNDFSSFHGRLAYGLPLLPKDRKGRWSDVLDGSHDEVFRVIAQQLVAAGHGDAAIRVGVEANGYWFPWSVTTDTVDEYKATFRRVAEIMTAVSPKFTFWMDINCGTVLTGSTDRLAPLYQMYPGSDVVDGLSMDHYNRYKLLAKDEATWQRAIAPSWAPGLRDGIAFARTHGIGFAVPEWGLDGVQGPGDSTYFMDKMWHLFADSTDVLVFENYFSEPDAYIKGDLFQTSQNPKSAAFYRKYWGRRG